MKILLVEDNSDHRELMRFVLTGHDSTWEVEAVEAGEEALRLLLGGEVFDLVFLDYSLPRRDGLEVLEEIRRGEAPPPVVVVTGRGDEQVAVKAMKGGAYDYVVKGEGYLQRLPVVAQRAIEAHQLAVERKRAEKALRESEERLRTVVEASLDAIIAVNVEGRLVLFNGAAQELFQYSEEEALNQSADILLREEIGKIHQERLEKFLKRGVGRCGHIGRRMEKLFCRKDGSLFEAEVSMSGGRLNGLRLVVLAIHDITSRKRDEEVLRQSEEKYRDIFDKTVEGIYRTTPIGYFDILNPAFARICGYASPEEMMERVTDIADQLYANPEDRLRFQKLIAVEGEVKDFEVQFKHPTKGLVWVSIHSKAIHDEQGNIRYYDGTIEDITERKQAEEELRRSEENFRHSLDDSPMGVRIVTVEGETIYANRAILDIYGYDSMEDLKTTPVEKRYTPESHADFLIRREKRQQGVDVPSEYTINIIRKDGEIRHLQVFRKEILWDGERQFQVLYNDITDRKRVEDALRESEESYRLIFENAPIGITHFDQEGTVTACNQHLAEILGAPKEKIIGINMLTAYQGHATQSCLGSGAVRERSDIMKGSDLSVTGAKSSTIRTIYTSFLAIEWLTGRWAVEHHGRHHRAQAGGGGIEGFSFAVTGTCHATATDT